MWRMIGTRHWVNGSGSVWVRKSAILRNRWRIYGYSSHQILDLWHCSLHMFHPSPIWHLLGGIPTPLKNYGLRQLGWWHSQLIWKITNGLNVQTINQDPCISMYSVFYFFRYEYMHIKFHLLIFTYIDIVPFDQAENVGPLPCGITAALVACEAATSHIPFGP